MAHHCCMRLFALHVLGWLAVLDLECNWVEEVYSCLMMISPAPSCDRGVARVTCCCAPSDDKGVARLFAWFAAVCPWRRHAAGLLGSCQPLGLAKFDALLLDRGRGAALLLDRGRSAWCSRVAASCHWRCWAAGLGLGGLAS